MIVDAWMQHPNAEWIGNPMFDSLRRWRPGKWSEKAHPILDTLAEMDRAGVTVGMLCAWHGPHGPMISNDEVAQYCRAYPDRFVGIASVDLFRPMEAVRELRFRVKRDGFKGVARSALAGACRRMTAATIHCLQSAANSMCRFAHRSDMPGPCASRNRGGLSLISIGLRWSFPSFAFSVVILARHGSVRCFHS